MQLHQSIEIQSLSKQECQEIQIGRERTVVQQGEGMNYKKQEVFGDRQILSEVDGNRVRVTDINMFQENRSIVFSFEECACDNVQIIQNIRDYSLVVLLRNGVLCIVQFEFQGCNEYEYKQIELAENRMDVQNVEYIINYQDGQPQIISIINNNNVIEIYQCQINVDNRDKEVDKLFQIDVINYHFYQQIIKKVIADSQIRILKLRLFHNFMLFVLTSDGILRLVNLYSKKIVQYVQLNGFNDENIGNNEFSINYDSIESNNSLFRILVSIQRLNLENQSLHLLELQVKLKISDLEVNSLEQINQNIEPMISMIKFKTLLNRKIKQIVKQVVIKQCEIFVLVQQINEQSQQIVQISKDKPLFEHVVCQWNEILSMQKVNSSVYVISDHKIDVLVEQKQTYSKIVMLDLQGMEQKARQVYILCQSLYQQLDIQDHQIDCQSIQQQMESRMFKVDTIEFTNRLRSLELRQCIIEFINMIYECEDNNLAQNDNKMMSMDIKVQQSNENDQMLVFNKLIANQIVQQFRNKMKFIQKVQLLLCYVKMQNVQLDDLQVENMMVTLNYKQMELNSMVQSNVMYDFIRHSTSNYDYMYNEDILNYENIEKYAEEQLQNYKVGINIMDLISNNLHVDNLIMTLFNNSCYKSLCLLFQQMDDYLDYSINFLFMNLITQVKMNSQDYQNMIGQVDKIVSRLATSDTLIFECLFSSHFKQFINADNIVYNDSNSIKIYYLFMIDQIEKNQCHDNLKLQSELAMKTSLLEPRSCLQQELYQYVIAENLQRHDYRNSLNLINNVRDGKVDQFYEQLVDTIIKNDHVGRFGQLKMKIDNYQAIIQTLKQRQAFQLNEIQNFINKKNETKVDRIVLLSSNRNYSRILNHIYYMNGEYQNSVRVMYNYMQILIDCYQKTDSLDIRNKLVMMILIAIQKVQVSMDLSRQTQVYNYSEHWIDKKQVLKLKTIFTSIKYLEEIRNAKIGVQEIIYSRANQYQVVKEIVRQFSCLEKLEKANEIVLQFDEFLCQEYFSYLLDKWVENRENQKDNNMYLQLIHKLLDGLDSDRIMNSQIIEIMFLKYSLVHPSVQILDQVFGKCPDHVVSLAIQFGKMEHVQYLLKKHSKLGECPIHGLLANQVLIQQ